MQKSISPRPADLRHRNGESGNVLFLILIAVALFAALSYAVTQSSRSGGGDVSSEKSLVSSSELTQYPAGLRTSVMRMIVSSGITPDQLLFDPPSAFDGAAGAGAKTITAANQKQSVFHPAGGGATYQNAPGDIMSATGTNGGGTWHFNALFQVSNIGTTTSSSDTGGNDLIAFLYGVSKGVCQKIDDQLGIGTIPAAGTPLTEASVKTDQLATGVGASTSDFPTAAGEIIGGTSTPDALTGQPFACLDNGSGIYIYYHVIIER